MQKYNTKQRNMLLSFLRDNADSSFTVLQIYEHFRGKISQSAVYRNVAALEEEGSIHRVSKSGSKKMFFRYCAAQQCRDHLHISCTKCGKTFHVDSALSNSIIKNVNNSAKFEIDPMSTVFYGKCNTCKKEESKL